MENKNEIESIKDSVWKEKIYLETAEFIITGEVFQPKIGKKSRMITDILTSKKEFIAIKNCRIERKTDTNKEPEYHNFIQINRSKIIFMRPDGDD